MNERRDPASSSNNAPVQPVVKRHRRFAVSLVWIVPIVAAIVGALLIARSFLQEGPSITVEFRTAEGIEPGKTEVRYKEVTVGRVQRVRVGTSRQTVLVDVRLAASASDLAVDDTKFWVVRPRIGATGVSGLGTLLSGAYIAADAGVSGNARKSFVGLEQPPLVLRGEPGRSFTLRTRDLGSLDIGSPVYYRRVRVGRVVGFELDSKTDSVLVQIFVEAPNEKLVSSTTRFWSSSGFDFSFDSQGVKVDTQSIASLLGGGIAFANPVAPNERNQAREGREFSLFEDERMALAPPDGQPTRIRMRFAQSIRGLAEGAAVEFVGVEIGRVRAVHLQYDEKTKRFPAIIEADVYLDRLGRVLQNAGEQLNANQRDEDAARSHIAFIEDLVGSGLRAQLRTANLISGQMYVALDFLGESNKRIPMEMQANALNVPTVPSPLSDLQPQIANIVARISKIPFDSIGRDLQRTLASANTAITQLTPEAQHAMQDVRRTLEEVQRNLASPDAPVQRNANQALRDLQRAARSLRVLGDYLQRHPESLLRGGRSDAPLELENREGPSK